MYTFGTRSGAVRLAAAALVLAVLAVVIGAFVRSPTEHRDDHVGSGVVTVEVELYSGRPNPRFILQPSEVSEFTSRLAALPTTDDPAPAVALGYRGLQVETRHPGTTSRIGVFDGVVTIHEPAGEERLLSDRDRDMERWLIDLGADSLGPEEVFFLRSELGR